jgi:hypothetical protein
MNLAAWRDMRYRQGFGFTGISLERVLLGDALLGNGFA